MVCFIDHIVCFIVGSITGRLIAIEPDFPHPALRLPNVGMPETPAKFFYLGD
jgi:hypothetical protein